MTKYYTGIGSRETPDDVLTLMIQIAEKLAATGWTLRSGAAGGADTAFESGAWAASGVRQKEIFIPWDGFSDRQIGRSTYSLGAFHRHLQKQAYDEASQVHPAWEKCSAGARKLHARNVFQVFGQALNEPSKFVICWTPGGKTTGGTATAIRLAEKAKIPVFNLADPLVRARLDRWVRPKTVADDGCVLELEADPATRQALALHDAPIARPINGFEMAQSHEDLV